jgi:hypothetical protein
MVEEENTEEEQPETLQELKERRESLGRVIASLQCDLAEIDERLRLVEPDISLGGCDPDSTENKRRIVVKRIEGKL